MRSATSSAGLRSRDTFAQSSRFTAASRVDRSRSDEPTRSTLTRNTQPPRSVLNSTSTTSAPCASTIGPMTRSSAMRSIPWRSAVELGEDMVLSHSDGQKKTRAPVGVPRDRQPPNWAPKPSAQRANGQVGCLEARERVSLALAGGRRGGASFFFEDDELHAAILGAIARRHVRNEWLLLSVPARHEAVGRDSVLRQPGDHRLSSLLAQHFVVVDRPAVVRMALHFDAFELSVPNQGVGDLGQEAEGIGKNDRAVEGELDLLLYRNFLARDDDVGPLRHGPERQV